MVSFCCFISRVICLQRSCKSRMRFFSCSSSRWRFSISLRVVRAFFTSVSRFSENIFYLFCSNMFSIWSFETFLFMIFSWRWMRILQLSRCFISVWLYSCMAFSKVRVSAQQCVRQMRVTVECSSCWVSVVSYCVFMVYSLRQMVSIRVLMVLVMELVFRLMLLRRRMDVRKRVFCFFSRFTSVINCWFLF